ncbi:molybdenum ABC transporter ATP-binding protein [Thiocapsa bogorovii]|uniref:molybdenum ABC transporter ATP-binding protein n=1 Tax=Thiocapsa bogorovii TaxID=521689 RepID=UPI001E5794C7|nr:molybdenum ABC transporter ATP-binding protein [Thiocapsa bogorovii]UHD17402.1 molybdenum ABC transporter ATP-binding protein [Thiocapsa bogorovii]
MEPINARFNLDWPGFNLAVDLELPGRGVTGLFGHSGSGKTTLLRCIAGLVRAPEGRLVFRGEVWQDANIWVPTHQRALGYVFQEASLFTHLKVMGNLRYGQKRARSRVARSDRVSLEQAIELLGIGHLLERRPASLSGGERQRVAIARALASSPQVLLMDEPLAALDIARKQEILPYLERLHDELAIPVLYVSHAPDEVARLADHLVVMDAGRVLASGPLKDTLARLDLLLAFSEDAGVVIDAVVAAHDNNYHLSRLDFPGGNVVVAQRKEPVGHRLRVRIHARDVSLTLERATGTSIANLLPATVVEIADADTPAHCLVRLDAGGTPLIARITRRSLDHLGVARGKPMWAQIKAVALLGD